MSFLKPRTHFASNVSLVECHCKYIFHLCPYGFYLQSSITVIQFSYFYSDFCYMIVIKIFLRIRWKWRLSNQDGFWIFIHACLFLSLFCTNVHWIEGWSYRVRITMIIMKEKVVVRSMTKNDTDDIWIKQMPRIWSRLCSSSNRSMGVKYLKNQTNTIPSFPATF